MNKSLSTSELLARILLVYVMLVFGHQTRSEHQLPKQLNRTNHAQVKKKSADCKEREEFIKKRLVPKTSPSKVLDATLTNKTQVIIFGETHGGELDQDVYPQLLIQLKKRFSDLDCFFYETTIDQQKKIDDYLQGKIDAFEYRTLIPHTRLLDATKALGVKFYAIDESDSERKRSFWERFDNRNKKMANHIHTKLADGHCKRAVFVTGGNHVALRILETPDFLKKRIKEKTMSFVPIPDRLRKWRYHVKAIRIDRYSDLKTTQFTNPYRSRECGWSVRLTDQAVGFTIDRSNVRMVDLSSFTGPDPIPWREFDAALIYP